MLGWRHTFKISFIQWKKKTNFGGKKNSAYTYNFFTLAREVPAGWADLILPRIGFHSSGSAACVLYQCLVCTDKSFLKRQLWIEDRSIKLLLAPWLLKDTAALKGACSQAMNASPNPKPFSISSWLFFFPFTTYLCNC